MGVAASNQILQISGDLNHENDFLMHQTVEEESYDGSYTKGFLIKDIPKTYDNENNGVKDPFYAIISIEAYTCFYHK